MNTRPAAAAAPCPPSRVAPRIAQLLLAPRPPRRVARGLALLLAAPCLHSRITRALVLLLVALLAPACATSPPYATTTPPPSPEARTGIHHPLLDDMLGEWVLHGTIAGDETTHDITVDRVLNDGYVRIRERSRERDADGWPAYEAIVFIGWDTPNERYTCLWLDNTSGEGLSEAYRDSVGTAVRDGDTLPFLFRFPDGSPWHTTFSYDRAADTWAWHMIGDDPTAEPFAQVTLVRR